MNKIYTLLLLFAFTLSVICAQSPPPVITYAGKVSKNGAPYSGNGQFKFAFVNADANVTYWSHDGTSTYGAAPTGYLTLPVNGGYYSILLGNTAIPGMSAIDPAIFSTHSDVHLRVWFSDGVAAFEELAPHRPFASVPYALNAGISAGSISKSMLSVGVQADLNRTITKTMLSQQLLDDLNRTIDKSMLAQEVLTDLNATPQAGSITQQMLASDVQAMLSGQSSSIFAPTLANPYGYAGGTPIEHDYSSYTVPNDKVLVILTSAYWYGNVNANGQKVRESLSGISIFPSGTVVTTSGGNSTARNGWSGLLFDPLPHISPVIVPIGYQVPSDQVLVLTSGTGADSGGTLGGSFSRDFASSMPTIHHSGSILNAGGCGYLVDASMLASAGSSSSGSTPAPGSITKSMLDQEVLADLNASGSGSTPGGIIAVPYGQNAPAGYSPYTLGDRKGFAWTEKTAVTQVRYPYDAVVALNNEIYFVGGSTSPGFRGLSGSGSNVTTVEKYNLGTNSWQAVASLPAGRFRYATAALNGKIHVMGGNGLNTSVVYDPSTNQWTAGPNLPSVVENGRAVSFNGKIYLIGGQGAAGNQVLEFDPSTNQWSTKASMTTARSGVELVVFENRIWAIGSDQTQSNAAESFDPVVNSWRVETSLPNTADIAWVANGTIYCGVYGGEIFVFDSTNSLWRQSGAMPGYFDAYGYAISAAVVTGSRVHLVGGPSNAAVVGFGPENSNKHYVADLNSSVLGVRDLFVRDGNASSGPGSGSSTPAPGSITKSMLSSEVLTDLNRTQSVVGTSDDAFTEGLRAYLRPMLAGGVWHSWGLEGIPVTLRAPKVEGRFLTYQWYKGGSPIFGATGTEYVIPDFNATRDAGDYEIRVSNAFATLKTKAVLKVGIGSGVYGRVGFVDYDDPMTASYASTLFLKSSGNAVGSGSNYFGEIGDGTSNQYLSPVVSLFFDGSRSNGLISVTARTSHALYLKADGTLYGVGLNSYGQLGDGTTINKKYLAPIPNVGNIAQVSAGDYHTMFVKTDGTLWGMGANWSGALGDGTTTQRTSPVQVSGVSGVAQVATGTSHTMFVKTDGTLWGMGYNSYGQLGDGSTLQRTSPVQVPGVSNVAQLSLGNRNTMYVKTDGTLWGMGRNNYGQLGDGSTTDRTSPVQVPGVSNIAQVSAGDYHTMFVKKDGTLWAMGSNNYGQFGNGTTISTTTPVQVGNIIDMEEQPFAPESVSDVVQSERPAGENPTHVVRSAANLEMLWVEPGTFTMGAPLSEPGRGSHDQTESNVTISNGFYMGKYEVTQVQYEAVMIGNTDGLSATPSTSSGYNRPVESVSWDNIQLFLARLNNQEQQAARLPNGWEYALPTEAQWEYTCRAGTTTAYSVGSTITTVDANYVSSGFGESQDVGSYAPNPWGFYDMHGNVWELVEETLMINYKVKRGGSFMNATNYLRSAHRDGEVKNWSPDQTGFRLVFRPI